MKVDLCMWAKDGAQSLPLVLERIENVVPSECIAQRIFVDDKSLDNSREIAREFNWTVYKNPTGWVSGGANEALRHVTSEFFVSFEQDLLLARDWWSKIPHYMERRDVIVAQGVRFATIPSLRIYETEQIDKARLKNQWSKRIPDYFWSFDNNIFRTSTVRQLGGFPAFERLTVDYFFKVKLERETNYRWIVDPTVISDHVRLSIRQHFDNLNRIVLYSTKPTELEEVDQASLNLFSWLSSWISLRRSLGHLHAAIRLRHPQFFLVYPYLRLLEFRWLLLRRKRVDWQLTGEPVRRAQLLNEQRHAYS